MIINRVRPVFWLALVVATCLGLSKLAELYEYQILSNLILFIFLPISYVTVGRLLLKDKYGRSNQHNVCDHSSDCEENKNEPIY